MKMKPSVALALLAMAAVLTFTSCDLGGGKSGPDVQTGTLVVKNNSSYTIYYLYVSSYPVSSWAGAVDQLGTSTIYANGGSFTLVNIPAGYYSFMAQSSGHTVTWLNDSSNYIGAGSTFTWTLVDTL